MMNDVAVMWQQELRAYIKSGTVSFVILMLTTLVWAFFIALGSGGAGSMETDLRILFFAMIMSANFTTP
ncbi:MAG: hypothetical protein ACQEQV_09825, partial [Fibrobacterota bacterium]